MTLAGRNDGGLNVSSDGLLGLILSGPDSDKVAEAIEPAIKALFEHRGFREVTVHHGTAIADALQEPKAISIRVQHGGVATE